MMMNMFMAGLRVYPHAPKPNHYSANGAPYAPVGLKPTQPAPPILMYIMPHFPGNTPRSWRRQFYGDLAHGLKIIDLFTFVTSLSGYTCDYTDSDGGTYKGVRRGFAELGMFEDIIQASRAVGGCGRRDDLRRIGQRLAALRRHRRRG